MSDFLQPHGLQHARLPCPCHLMCYIQKMQRYIIMFMFTTFPEYVIVVFRIKLHVFWQFRPYLIWLQPSFPIFILTVPSLQLNSFPHRLLQSMRLFPLLPAPSLPFPTRLKCPSSKNSALLPLLL